MPRKGATQRAVFKIVRDKSSGRFTTAASRSKSQVRFETFTRARSRQTGLFISSAAPAKPRASKAQAPGRVARRPATARAADVRTIAPEALARRLEAQAGARRLQRQHEQARRALAAFRVRKADRGQIVFVGINGQRGAAGKGRKGFALYVTKTGKKRLLEPRQSEPFKPRKVGDLKLPLTKQLLHPVAEYQRERTRAAGGGKTLQKGHGRVKVKAIGGNDFNKRAVAKLARGIKRVIEGQASRRVFVISAQVLVKLPDGTTRVVRVEVPIEKADHIGIKLAGMENFVKQKFYAHLARELAAFGLVTQGSANNVRRFNKGLDKSEWLNRQGDAWFGREDTEICKVEAIDWQMNQA